MSLAALRARFPPPFVASSTHIDWALLESELGLDLPGDYREFSDLYGPSIISESIVLFHPSATRGRAHLQSAVSLYLSSLLTLCGESPALAALGVFPQEGGLFPFADSNDGDVICWLTSGPPDMWLTMMVGHYGEVTSVDLPFADLLVELLNDGQLAETLGLGPPAIRPIRIP